MASLRTPQSLKEHLEQLHSEGAVDLDQPLRTFLSDRGLHIYVPETNTEEARSMIIVWPTIFGDDELVPLQSLSGSIDELRSTLEALRAELHEAIGKSGLG